MSDIINIQEQDYVFIGEQSKLDGQLSFYGPTKIAGEINGDVAIQGKSPLTIEPAGIIKGKLQCHDVEVYGNIEGEIISTGKVTVHSFAKLSGRVSAKQFSFNANAKIEIQGHAEAGN